MKQLYKNNATRWQKTVVIMFFGILFIASFIQLFPFISLLNSSKITKAKIIQVYGAINFLSIEYEYKINEKSIKDNITSFCSIQTNINDVLDISYNQKHSYIKILLVYDFVIWLILSMLTLLILFWVIYRIIKLNNNQYYIN